MTGGRVRCPTCFRTEVWEDTGGRFVEQPGGRRRPRPPAYLAAWETIAAWRAGGPSVVGTCDACGQPLVADGPAVPPVARWILPTPAGDLVIAEEITGPDGPMDLADADAFVRRQARAARLRAVAAQLPTLPFALIAVAFAVGILALWIWGAGFFATFVWQGMRTGGFTLPGGS